MRLLAVGQVYFFSVLLAWLVFRRIPNRRIHRRFSVPKRTHLPVRWRCQSVRVRGSPKMRTSLADSTACTCPWRNSPARGLQLVR